MEAEHPLPGFFHLLVLVDGLPPQLLEPLLLTGLHLGEVRSVQAVRARPHEDGLW